MYTQNQIIKIWMKYFFLFGKETKGLPEDILMKYIDKTIRIPMRETLRSLKFV